MLERKAIAWWFMARGDRSWWNYIHSTQHLSLGFLPPTSHYNSSLLAQWMPQKEILIIHHLLFLVSLCDPLHLACLLLFLMELFGLSLSKISSLIRPFHFMEATAVCRQGRNLCMSAAWGFRQSTRVSSCSIHYGKGCTERFFILLSVTARERSRTCAENTSFQFSQYQNIGVFITAVLEG